VIFLDASALVKAYVDEDGSSTVHAILPRLRGRLYLTAFVALEVLATLARRLRSQTLPRHRYSALRELFLAQLASWFNVVEVGPPVVQSACELAHVHRRIATGAMDLLHVASALKLRHDIGRSGLVIASSDRAFLDLARANHLSTFNPEQEPLAALMVQVRG
jgi:predicted nucleic acid-binding protein